MSTLRFALPIALLSLGTGCSDDAPGDTEATAPGVTDPASGPGPGTDPTDATPTSTSPTSATTPPGPATTADETTSTGPDCPANAPPAAPTVVDPVAGRIDVIPAALTISGSAFTDPDVGDAFGAVQVEIRRVRKGVVSELVWSAEVAGAAPPVVSLADGEFAEDAGDTLEDWEDHAVRMRYRDDHGDCSAWGAWSEDLVFRTDDGSTTLFDESVIRDFYLDIPPDSWDAINAEANPPGCVPFTRSYHTGTLRFEDQVLPGVGIKIKGGCGTSRDLGGKASFKVNLEWDDDSLPGCPAERRLLGEKSFTFNNGVQDQSATHERLGYSLYKDMDIPSPRAANVRLFVNDELWGLYVHVETIDRRFLSRWFDSNDGMLYEGTYWCDLTPENLPPTDEDDSKCLTREFSPGPCTVPDEGADPLDYSPLRTLVEQIDALPEGGFYPAVESFFDFDRFLSTWALESVISHWDGYEFNIKNNYRVYHDPSTGLWTLLSTGIDQTFVQEQDPWAVEGVLAVRCLAEPACEAAFAARLDEVNDKFDDLDLAGRTTAIFDQISPLVEEDPRKEYDFQTFLDRHQQLLNFIDDRPDEIRGYLFAHGF